jgi:hypothetical protein
LHRLELASLAWRTPSMIVATPSTDAVVLINGFIGQVIKPAGMAPIRNAPGIVALSRVHLLAR